MNVDPNTLCKMTLSVDVTEDISSPSFNEDLEKNLEELYTEGTQVNAGRKKRSSNMMEYVFGRTYKHKEVDLKTSYRFRRDSSDICDVEVRPIGSFKIHRNFSKTKITFINTP